MSGQDNNGEDYFLDEVSTMHELPSLANLNRQGGNGRGGGGRSTGILINKKSLSAENMVGNMLPKNFNRNNSEENVVVQRVASTSTADRDSSSRPRGRLNFYDSDTFSENFLINGSHPNKNFKKNGDYKFLNIIISEEILIFEILICPKIFSLN